MEQQVQTEDDELPAPAEPISDSDERSGLFLTGVHSATRWGPARASAN